jgi:predicted RNA polymerase sigma factor
VSTDPGGALDPWSDFIEGKFEQFYAPIVNWLTRGDNDFQRAQDATMKAFLRAELNRPMLLSHPNLVGWLYKTARNWYINASRKWAYGIDLKGGFPDDALGEGTSEL